MRLIQKRATLFLCSAAVAAFATSAFARPVHHHHRHRHASAAVAQNPMRAQNDVADRDMRYPSFAAQPAAGSGDVATGRSRRHGRQSLAEARAQAQSHSNSAYGGFSDNSLVAEARKYIGTNPTGRGSLWCGAFMDLVLKRTGHPGGGNLAWGYEHYGTRIAGPQVGAIAVMGRRGGGHVGIVSGIDPNGNPIIISGNHNHTTAESVYPRSRIAAYVVPGN
jgi:uncharacterized protein (TIGR02594 family)